MTTLAALRFFDIVLFLHIASVVVAFGVIFTYPIIVPATIQRSPRNASWLHGMQQQVARYIITPGATLVLLTGIYLAADLDVFSKWWVAVPLLANLVILGLVGGYFTPRAGKLAKMAERDVNAPGPDGEVAFSQEYQDLWRQVGMVAAFMSLLILITIFIMVVGPTL